MNHRSTLISSLLTLSALLGASSAKAAGVRGAPPASYGALPSTAPEPVSGETSSSDEESRYPKKSIGLFVQPLNLAVGFYGGAIDFRLGKAVNLAVSGAYYRKASTDADRTTTSTAVQLQLGPEIYPLGKAFNQLYLFPSITLASARATATGANLADGSARAGAVGIGATIGYQWTYTSGFSFRLGGGATYYSLFAKDDDSSAEIALTGVVPNIDATLGWTF